jgi:pimeloyl-ACP methyl ester carboxylesterase
MGKGHHLAILLALPLLSAGCVQYSKVFETRRTSDLAVTESQLQLARTQERRPTQPLEQLGHFLDAANEARLDLATNPNSALLRSDYNFAVARVIDIISAQKLQPWDAAVEAPSDAGASWRVRLTPPFPQPQYHPRHFQFTPSDRYNFRGKLVGERVLKAGLGAPLVVVGRDLDYLQIDKFAQGRNVYYGLTAVIRFRGRDCEIILQDPLEKEDITLDGRSYPLAGDFQGPLAIALAELDMRRREILGLFKPQLFEQNARLARLQPFSPGKIPVIFIHGLSNSPATWAPVVEFLRGDPVIRQNYQFWFFSYPSGLPYPLSAAMLRRQLGEIRKRYPNLKDAVVVGHSMGGMISRLLITDSGMKLWNTYFDQPPTEIPFSQKTREVMGGSLIFKPTPGISRVVFVSASHRGSEKAVNFWGRLGAAIVGNPLKQDTVYKEAIAHAKPAAQARTRNRLPNSIDMLDPQNLFVSTVNELPLKPGVPFHSLIGDRGRGGFLDHTRPHSSDSIVPYWSSHVEGAASERIIPSGHWSHLHPLGMAEIKRILIKHLGN